MAGLLRDHQPDNDPEPARRDTVQWEPHEIALIMSSSIVAAPISEDRLRICALHLVLDTQSLLIYVGKETHRRGLRRKKSFLADTDTK